MARWNVKQVCPAGTLLLAWLQREHGLETADAQAARLGVTRMTLHRWITGRCVPSLGHAVRLEQIAGVPAWQWFGDSASPAPAGSAPADPAGSAPPPSGPRAAVRLGKRERIEPDPYLGREDVMVDAPARYRDR